MSTTTTTTDAAPLPQLPPTWPTLQEHIFSLAETIVLSGSAGRFVRYPSRLAALMALVRSEMRRVESEEQHGGMIPPKKRALGD